jgi:hypothetical protein
MALYFFGRKINQRRHLPGHFSLLAQVSKDYGKAIRFLAFVWRYEDI